MADHDRANSAKSEAAALRAEAAREAQREGLTEHEKHSLNALGNQHDAGKKGVEGHREKSKATARKSRHRPATCRYRAHQSATPLTAVADGGWRGA